LYCSILIHLILTFPFESCEHQHAFLRLGLEQRAARLELRLELRQSNADVYA
jgi:hypothetical protein